MHYYLLGGATVAIVVCGAIVLLWRRTAGRIGFAGKVTAMGVFASLVLILLVFYSSFLADQSLRASTSHTIGAIRQQIDAIKEAEKQRTLRDVYTLRKEMLFNQLILEGALAHRDSLLATTGPPKYSPDFFQTYAYSQGLVTSCLADEDLVNRMLLVYHQLCVANVYRQMIIDINNSGLSNEARFSRVRKYNATFLKICEAQRHACEIIFQELATVEDSLRSHQ